MKTKISLVIMLALALTLPVATLMMAKAGRGGTQWCSAQAGRPV